MTEHKAHNPSHPHGRTQGSEALSPNGKIMTLDDLPPAGTERWVIRRKAEVVAGVRGGLISLSEACRRYRLSVDEFKSWEKLLQRHGLPGLRVTRSKKYRRPSLPKNGKSISHKGL
ncbi:MAG: DUF1153 domain-containing protein [Rhodospirillales bacterium]|nr:DUF1153 domain-containing protein [Rhodospirillales bacterium]